MLHHLFVRVKEPPQVSRRGKLLERTCELIRQSNPAAQQTITIVSLIKGKGGGARGVVGRLFLAESTLGPPPDTAQIASSKKQVRNVGGGTVFGNRSEDLQGLKKRLVSMSSGKQLKIALAVGCGSAAPGMNV